MTAYTNNLNPPKNSAPLEFHVTGDVNLSNVLERLDCMGAALDTVNANLVTLISAISDLTTAIAPVA